MHKGSCSNAGKTEHTFEGSHVPKESNFNLLLALVAQHNSTLRDHPDNSRTNAK